MSGRNVNRGTPLYNETGQLTRRGFFKVVGFIVAATGAGAIASACEPETTVFQEPTPTMIPTSLQYPEVPFAPAVPPPANILVVFTPHEAQTVEALTARLMPGTPADPGAREAGVTNYIDKKLAFNKGFVEPTYHQPPFAQVYEGNPPQQANQPGGYQVIYVAKDQIDRYGYQSILSPLEIYRAGLASVDKYSQMKFNQNFVDLSEDQQDQILSDMESGDAKGFDQPSAKDFFDRLQQDTVEGMFSDPAYGGNRDMVGWKMIGYPGAQRAYTPKDLHTEGPPRPPQSLAELHHFHPGQPANPNVVVPNSSPQEQQPYQNSPTR